MQRDDIHNINSVYNEVVNEGAISINPQADSQQGLSPVIPTIIKQKKKNEDSDASRDEECEACGCSGNQEDGETTPHNQSNEDDDIQMAKNEIYNTVFHATKIYDKLKTVKNLEGWVQSKITKAADYLNSVKNYLDYENLQSEENEERDVESSINSGADNILNKLTAILSRESKENLHKVLYEVVKLIEEKN